MFLGIIVPSFITLVGGILTYNYINEVSTRQGLVQIADDFREHALELRRNEKNFFHYKNAEHFSNLNGARLVISRSIKAIPEKESRKIGEGEFSLLEKSLNIYSQYLNDLYTNYQKETKEVEEVRAEGRKLETFVSRGIHAEDLTINFILHLRLLEKNYMLFRDKNSYNKLNSGLSALRNMTPVCNECLPYIKVVRRLFKTYNKSDSIANNIQLTGNSIETSTREMAIHERQKISSFIKRTQRLLLIALGLLCTLGPLLVYKTAKKIVAPINRLAEITKRIADGDTSLRAPIREHDETYTLSTSFNTMLNKLQLTYESLEKSMDLLKEKQAQLVDAEKRASLGLLVSGVAHELNNPLNNISLIAERMAEEREDLSKEEVKGLNHILWQCERATHIVDGLLDFASARKSTLMEKQDIARIVRESIYLVGSQLKINNIDLIKDIPDETIFINGNRSKLEQILVSIFTNAIQAMKNNGTLTVSLTTDTENNTVSINISDTGPGIPEEDMKNIYEPFFTTKPVGEGTGLGLSVCRSLVQEHRGKIEVESAPGEGTTFAITLPLYVEQEVAQE